MNGARVEAGPDGRIALVGALSFATVPDAWMHVKPAVAAAPGLTVDLKGITGADSAGLALLVEFMREARRAGKEVSFVNMPAQMLAIARASGLERVLTLLPGGAGEEDARAVSTTRTAGRSDSPGTDERAEGAGGGGREGK